MQLDGTLEALINSELAEALLITALTIPGLCLGQLSVVFLAQTRAALKRSGRGGCSVHLSVCWIQVPADKVLSCLLSKGGAE